MLHGISELWSYFRTTTRILYALVPECAKLLHVDIAAFVLAVLVTTTKVGQGEVTQ